MKLETLKDLEKLINLCRKTGVDTIKVDNIELKLGEAPYKAPKATKQETQANTPPTYAPGGITEEIKVEGLTQEQLLYWSTGGDLQDSQ
jgi:hypothetical protein